MMINGVYSNRLQRMGYIKKLRKKSTDKSIKQKYGSLYKIIPRVDPDVCVAHECIIPAVPSPRVGGPSSFPPNHSGVTAFP
jgi:hypothetical protein